MKFYWMKLVDSLCNIYLRKIIATFFKEKGSLSSRVEFSFNSTQIKVLKRTKKIVRKLNNNKTQKSLFYFFKVVFNYFYLIFQYKVNKKIEFRDAYQRGNLRLKRAKKITPKIYFKS